MRADTGSVPPGAGARIPIHLPHACTSFANASSAPIVLDLHSTGYTMLIFPTIIGLFGLAHFAHAWGNGTHSTIGYLADRFLLSETVLSPSGVLISESFHHPSVR